MRTVPRAVEKYIDTSLALQVISCIETGTPLLMENLPEDIDAVLDPVIGKQTIKRGRNLILKIGDAEVEYDQNFRSVTEQLLLCLLYLANTKSHKHTIPPSQLSAHDPVVYQVCCCHCVDWVVLTDADKQLSSALQAVLADQAGQSSLQA